MVIGQYIKFLFAYGQILNFDDNSITVQWLSGGSKNTVTKFRNIEKFKDLYDMDEVQFKLTFDLN
jgi:hypothetical protein